MSQLRARIKRLEDATSVQGKPWTALRVFLNETDPTGFTGPSDREIEDRRRQGFDVTNVHVIFDNGHD